MADGTITPIDGEELEHSVQVLHFRLDTFLDKRPMTLDFSLPLQIIDGRIYYAGSESVPVDFIERTARPLGFPTARGTHES